MNDKQLRAFIAVAESRSFSKAESRLFITRQAVQKQIRALETELGESLFVTSRSGTYLTPFGEFVYPHARKILQEYTDLVDSCSMFLNEKISLRIGNALETIPANLPDLLNDFRNSYPAADIELRYVKYDDKTRLLDNNSVDLVLDYVEKTWQRESYEFFPLCSLRYTCFVNEKSDLARKEMIMLDDLNDHTVTYWYPGNKRLEILISHARLNVQIRNVEDNNVISVVDACRRNEIYISRDDHFQQDIPVKRIPFDDRFQLTMALIYRVPASIGVKTFKSRASAFLSADSLRS